jgi:hypothetical protein
MRVPSPRTKDVRASLLMHECHNAPSLLAAALVFSTRASQYVANTCRECGAEGQMDDLIGRLGATVGVERTAAEKPVAVIAQFPPKQGLCKNMQPRIRPQSGFHTFARECMSLPREIQGKMRPARLLAQSPSSASSSDI